MISEWTWDDGSDSWLWGDPGNGAGVFYETAGHPTSPKAGWYYGLVVGDYIREVSTGPFPDKESAMRAAEDKFCSYKKDES